MPYDCFLSILKEVEDFSLECDLFTLLFFLSLNNKIDKKAIAISEAPNKQVIIIKGVLYLSLFFLVMFLTSLLLNISVELSDSDLEL